MARRRGWGDGSVQRTQDGAGWVAVFEVPGGARRRRVKRRAGTKAEAMALLRQMRAEYDVSGGLADGRRLVSETLADYLSVRRDEGLQAKTLEGDEWMVSIIKSGLGGHKLASLTVAHCDEFLARAVDGLDGGEPLGRRSLSRIRWTLIRAIKNDVRRGLVSRNVAEFSVLPATTKVQARKRALTRGQLIDLLEAASGVTAALVDLSGRNGLRPAEARGLRWSRVDLERGTLTVDAQVNRKGELTEAKTRRAYRTIRIDSQTIERLVTVGAEQETWRQAAGPVWVNTGLVVATRSGRPVSHRNFYRSLGRLCGQLGIEPAISAYELRHTAISLQADAGHPAWQIADWAGTSERMITDVYRHRLSDISGLGPV